MLILLYRAAVSQPVTFYIFFFTFAKFLSQITACVLFRAVLLLRFYAQPNSPGSVKFSITLSISAAEMALQESLICFIFDPL